MTNNRKRSQSKKSISKYLIFVIVILAVIFLAVFLIKGKGTEHSLEPAQENDTISVLTFPYEFDEEQLMIESVFSYSGLNPDSGDTSAENAGAIQLKNISESYLDSLNIIITLENGNQLTFLIEDIPAGQSVIAFDTENKSYNDEAVISVESEAEYADSPDSYEGKLAVTADESGISVTNQTENQLSGIDFKYHCILEGIYWGGLCYEDKIETLAPGESLFLETEECYFGEAAVVKIMMD